MNFSTLMDFITHIKIDGKTYEIHDQATADLLQSIIDQGGVGGGSGDGSSCKCPKRWDSIEATPIEEFYTTYTTVDDQPLDIQVSDVILYHHWDNEDNEGKIQFYSRGIPDEFFYLNERLSSIYIENPCPKIGKNCFRGCINLGSCSLPDSVQILGDSAFQNCQKLTGINLPEGIKKIPNRCFIGCHRPVTINPGSSSERVEYRDGLVYITLPSTIVEIGEEAFEDCTSLKEVNIPSGLKTIGKRAFQQCESMTFTNWDFMDNIESLGEKAFQSCHVLNFGGSDVRWQSGSGYWYIDNRSSANPTFNYFSKLDEITPEQFSMCYGIYNMVLHDKVHTIGSKAFMNSYNLNSIYIPQSVKKIGKQAFFSDSGKADHHVAPSIVYIDDLNDYLKIDFEDSKSHPNSIVSTESTSEKITLFNLYNYNTKAKITNLDIDVETLGSYMFVGLKDIENVTFSSKIKKIENRAFYKAKITGNIDASNSNLEDVGGYAFVMTEDVDTINFSGCTHLTRIADDCFKGFEETIDTLDLSGCTSLNSIPSLSINIRHVNLNDSGINTLPDKCFYNITVLQSCDLSNTNVSTIGKQAFYGCTSLRTINVENCTGLQSIGEQAFSACSNLAEVDLHTCTGLTTIVKKAFEKCENLKSVNLTGLKQLTSIGEQALYYSGGTCLEEIDLSTCTALQTIDSKALYHVTKLTVPDTAPYLANMSTFCNSSTIKEVHIVGANKVAEGLSINKATYYVDASMIEQYRSTYPSLTFEQN